MSGLLSHPLVDALEKELRTTQRTVWTTIEGMLVHLREKEAKVAMKEDILRLEILSMQTHAEKTEGLVVLNVGGHRYDTSVQTLRRLPDTFFTAYFSGRYAQSVCVDGSIFIDRNGELFQHVLEYMRDGVLSVTQHDFPTPGFMRDLKAEFDFYCIDVKPIPVRGGSGQKKL
jgi:hypothetical protein